MLPEEILRGIKRLSVLVLGDLCLDRWCIYDPGASEPSRETGLPRVAVVSRYSTPGAAGTVANNLVSLGAKEVSLLSVVGEDGFAYELMHELHQRSISSDLVIRSGGTQTFTYTKLINLQTGKEDLPRIDFINVDAPVHSVEQELIEKFEMFAPGFDVVIVSDQAETDVGGTITAPLRDAVTRLAAADPGKVIWVDSRRRVEHFRSVVLKPNWDEAQAACERIGAPGELRNLLQATQATHLVVTQGEEGATVIDGHGDRLVPGRRVANPVDICGAGDSFTAGAACAHRISGDIETAVRFGNLVASITVMQSGTGSATPAQVLEAAAEVGWA